MEVADAGLRTRAPPSKNLIVASLWLQDLASLGMNLFVVDFACVPPSAESFYQKDRTDHLLAEQLRCQALIGQQAGLGGDDIKIRGNAAHVTVVGDRQCPARIFNGGGLGSESLRKRAQIADSVLD